MTKKKNNRRRTTRRSKQREQQSSLNATNTIRSSNFVVEAGRGCYIARPDDVDNDWLFEWQDMNDYYYNDLDDNNNNNNSDIPDIAFDPHNNTITFCNASSSQYKVAYITIYTYNTIVYGRSGQILSNGKTVDNHHHHKQHGHDTTKQQQEHECITFIVLCPPRTFCCLCRVDIVDVVTNDDDKSNHQNVMDIRDIDMDSDVQEWIPHPNPNDEYRHALDVFPLQDSVADDDSSSDGRSSSFLCTQSEGGQLTHFFAGTYHAIDFRCHVGTPLLAVANGIVVDVRIMNMDMDDNTTNKTNDNRHRRSNSPSSSVVTGIGVSNLFEWNSIMIEVKKQPSSSSSSLSQDDNNDNDDDDGPLFVEYVHVATSVVQVGDVVTAGQVIGTSGNVGFCPEPHLHFCAYRSSDPKAPTVRVKFKKKTKNSSNCDNNGNVNDDTFLPVAGQWYTAQGPVDAPTSSSSSLQSDDVS